MAFDSKKTILLEKTYLYVRASLGFQLEGTSTEKIPTNNGFYRFFVDNLQKSIGNSYVNILYDSRDLTLQCFCSDLYMDELMSSDSSAIEDVVEELKKNTSTILEFETGVSSALAANHADNVLLHTDLDSISLNLLNFENYKFLPWYVERNVGGSSNSLGFSLDFSKFIFNPSKNVYIGDFCFNFNYRVQSTEQEIYFLFYLLPFSYGFSNNSHYSYCITYFDESGKLVKYYGEYYTTSSRISLTHKFKSRCRILSVSLCIFLIKSSYDVVSFFVGDRGNSCYFNKTLVLNSENLNLSFDYDFDGGYLDFRFYSSLDLSILNSFKYTFITDMGRKTFLGSDLNIVHEINDSKLCLCSNLPNFDFSSSAKSCSKLLGLSVSV